MFARVKRITPVACTQQRRAAPHTAHARRLKEKANELSDDLSKIEKALYQTQNRSGQDPLNFPIRLTNKLGHLNSLVSMGDFSPTEQDIAVKEYLTNQININLEIFDKLMVEEVKNFNELFNNNKLNYLISIE